MANPTALQMLIEDRLGEPVGEFVLARRPLRVPSWRELADEIGERTGVIVSDEALRLWVTGQAEQPTPEPERVA